MLSTLSAVFPEPLTNNIAFVFTNISSTLLSNFCYETIPGILEDAPQFQITNPIGLQKRYFRLKADQGMKNMRVGMREEDKTAELDVLDMLVNLFDWADGLDSQPTMRAISRYEESQNIVIAVVTSLTAQVNQLRRKVQEGVRKVRRVFIRD